MSSIYYSFQEQKEQDASFTIKAMGIQLGINVGIAIIIMIGFAFLRPRHTLVYSPKTKFLSKEHQPPKIERTAWFSWIKTVFKVKDEQLLEQIGCDAVVFIRFTRLLRTLLAIMSVIGVGVLIPINIVATKATGDWPPASGSIEILSISGINSRNGTEISEPNTNWYWSPFSATYAFSILIACFMYFASQEYIKMRQYYFRLPENETSMRSLLISQIPVSMRTDEKLKEWFQMTYQPKYPIKDSMIGQHSSKLTELTKKHELAVQQLETTLSSFLSDGKDTENKKRPTIRTGGIFCFGGKRVDAIEYYTKEVADLEQLIEKIRHDKKKKKPADYGWVSFERIEWAHEVQRTINQPNTVKLSPTPANLIWNNLPLSPQQQKAKRWTGRTFYWIFVFVWMIPMSGLSATSNLINLIRLIPNSAAFIDNHQILMGLIQAYFTPIMMALFFLVLPALFRFLSQQQGYWTETTLDRKVFLKLYVFFIINNLLVFTLTSMLIGIYGQLRALISSGSLPGNTELSSYIMQIAKNISDVSTFWINFMCLKSLSLTIDLAMLLPLLTITLRKLLTRPSPREVREMAKPPEFSYPQTYNLLLFFFTIALVYSALSPLVLPFALIYFTVASLVFKYLLMYIYVTKIESGGQIWPVLFQTVMTSVVFFQLTMILIMVLKGGKIQAYSLIPLPILTITYQTFLSRRLDQKGNYLLGTAPLQKPNFLKSQSDLLKNQTNLLKQQFQDPAYHLKLSKPTVHHDVKHLLSTVYPKQKKSDWQNPIEMKPIQQKPDRLETLGVQFEAITEHQIFSQVTQTTEDQTPLLGAAQAPAVTPPPIPRHKASQDRSFTSEYYELYASFNDQKEVMIEDGYEEKTEVEDRSWMDGPVPLESSNLSDQSTDLTRPSRYQTMTETERPPVIRYVISEESFVDQKRHPRRKQTF